MEAQTGLPRIGGRWRVPAAVALACAWCLLLGSTVARAQSGPRIEVNQDDLVKIDLRTTDIAHSLTIDAYRIAKRVEPGHPVTFEFRADHAGTFPYYCNLRLDDGCRRMRGELVVRRGRASEEGDRRTPR